VGEKQNLIIHHYQFHHQISVSSSKSIFLAIITLAQNVQPFTAKKYQVDTNKIFISTWPLHQ